jgi:hypothetical protein
MIIERGVTRSYPSRRSRCRPDPRQAERAKRGILEPCVDTHIALCALGDPARLTAEERALLLDPAVTAMLLEAASELPRHHADPFDRVLIAHALQDDLSVLTRTLRSPTTASASRRATPDTTSARLRLR